MKHMYKLTNFALFVIIFFLLASLITLFVFREYFSLSDKYETLRAKHVVLIDEYSRLKSRPAPEFEPKKIFSSSSKIELYDSCITRAKLGQANLPDITVEDNQKLQLHTFSGVWNDDCSKVAYSVYPSKGWGSDSTDDSPTITRESTGLWYYSAEAKMPVLLSKDFGLIPRYWISDNLFIAGNMIFDVDNDIEIVGIFDKK